MRFLPILIGVVLTLSACAEPQGVPALEPAAMTVEQGKCSATSGDGIGGTGCEPKID
ncbi:hypothetical protein [Halovulum sp. GXIMD14793]